MLDCCRTLDEIQRSGITLPEFTCLARCNGLQAQMRRADQIRQEQFLQDIQRTCRSETEYTVVSFSRQTLGQTGDGHFSPIGGYNAEKRTILLLGIYVRDIAHVQTRIGMVLVLDVARFKYPSYVIS
jgi:glutathione gamma-glutamylcysteinyltransferase